MLCTNIAILEEKEQKLLWGTHPILQLALKKNPSQWNQFKFSN